MEAVANARFIRISPRKLRLIGRLIQGQTLEAANNVLRFSEKKGAAVLKKVLDSAIANAENKKTVDIDSLYIKELLIDQGPYFKRFRPRAQGRATPVRKFTSHIKLVVAEK